MEKSKFQIYFNCFLCEGKNIVIGARELVINDVSTSV